MLDGAAGWGMAAAMAVGGAWMASTLVSRLNGKRSLVGRCRCVACGRAISGLDQVPLVSFWRLGGRCRACAAPIGAWVPAVEGGAALTVALAWWSQVAWNGLAAAVLVSLLGIACVVMAADDLRTGHVDDRAGLALALLGVVWRLETAAWEGGVVAALWDGVLGMATGVVVVLAVAVGYRAARGEAGVGGGDVWLVAVAGLWLGPRGALTTLSVAALWSVVAAVCVLVLRRWYPQAAAAAASDGVWGSGEGWRSAGAPMGPGFALGLFGGVLLGA